MYDGRIILAPPYVISITDGDAVCADLLQRAEMGIACPLGLPEFDHLTLFIGCRLHAAGSSGRSCRRLSAWRKPALGATTAPRL